MIHEEICTYEVAKLAKDKGFDWDCPMFYNPKGELKYGWAYDPMNSGLDVRDMLCHNSKLPRGFGAECTAPTQSLLQRWLRKERNIHITVDVVNGWKIEHTRWLPLKDHNDEHTMAINSNFRWEDNCSCFDTFELALEDALKYALENLT